MRLVDEARRDATAFGQPSQQVVSIGLTPSTMRMIGADFLVTAQFDLPGISLRLVEELSVVLVSHGPAPAADKLTIRSATHSWPAR